MSSLVDVLNGGSFVLPNGKVLTPAQVSGQLQSSIKSPTYLNSAALNLDELRKLIDTSTANNAQSAALAAARETNSFNAQQAAINRDFQATSARQAMEFEREMANQSMAFSERMANTQYQRAVEDLKAAGLSPLLAYGNLQTAAPQGVSASGHSASGSAASGVKADVSSAAQVERQKENQLLQVLSLSVNSALSLKALEVQSSGQDKSQFSSVLSSLLGTTAKIAAIAAFA